MKLSSSKIAKKRAKMSFQSNQGRQYLGLLMKSLQSGTGKAKALPYAVNYIKELSLEPSKVPSICEMGCGDGIVIAELKKILNSIGLDKPANFIGLDYNEELINIAEKEHDGIKFATADIVNGDLDKYEGQFDVVLLINVLHEVFSFYGRNEDGTIDFVKGKKIVEQTISNIKRTLTKGGMIIIVDGIDLDISPKERIRFRVKGNTSLRDFIKFKDTYRIIPTDYKKISEDTFETNARLFTRMITKSRFINSSTWEIEKEESHEYYSAKEYIDVISQIGLTLESFDLLGPSIGKWNKKFEILTKDVEFPFEYVIITATL